MSFRSTVLGVAVRGLLALAGAAGALLAVELGLRAAGAEDAELNPMIERVLAERGMANGEALAERARRAAERWSVTLVLDPEIGARPVLGDAFYSEYGTLVNEYALEKPPGVERLLFLGDSATRRGLLVEALRDLCGDEGIEWWNAGVEGFGTRQEVRYYARFNRPLRPDHILVTIHNNDLSPTPVVFFDESGRLVVFTPGRDSVRPNTFLLRWSRLYRRWLRGSAAGADDGSLEAEVSAALVELRALAAEDGARLSAVLLPILAPLATWTPAQQESRRTMLALLARLDVETYDLLEPLEAALAAGVDPCETPGDVHHPSRAVCAAFAHWLMERGLLAR